MPEVGGGGDITSHKGVNKGYKLGGKRLQNNADLFGRKEPKNRVGSPRYTNSKRVGTSTCQSSNKPTSVPAKSMARKKSKLK